MISNAAKRRLKYLSKLEANWDSYGAPAISPIALKSAEQILERLTIVPRSDGGLVLDFTYDGDEPGMCFDITPEGALELESD